MIKSILSHFSHPFFSQILEIEQIDSGYSTDLKFKVITQDESSYFIRLVLGSKTHKLKHEYDLLDFFYNQGLNVSKPILYEKNSEGAVLVTTWIKGEILANLIKNVSVHEQALWGIKSAHLLKRIHQQTLREEKCEDFYKRKISESMIDFDLFEMRKELFYIKKFIRSNMHLLYEKPCVIEHSDYHLGNLIAHDDLYVIDFNGSHTGSLYDEFYKLELFDFEISKTYVKSMIDAYFNSDERFNFFKIHRFYLAIACVNALRYGLQKDRTILNHEITRVRRILYAYDNFKLIYPRWYIS
ncbi:MAG: aminoglycoside phosphotransferase family protein [Acholeplasmataceae bacterium]|jgi:aminoglycoside phosphotransferase|nr:aminoglycoside phosphotransferase family protein [Acholeplasmataceae bacterium]